MVMHLTLMCSPFNGMSGKVTAVRKMMETVINLHGFRFFFSLNNER